MDVTATVMPENPTPQNNTEKMILEALEKMNNRMDNMEKKDKEKDEAQNKEKEKEEAQSEKGRSEASWQMPGSEA